MERVARFVQIAASQKADGSPVLYALDDPGPVHPAGGPRIPRPALAADMRGLGIDVSGRDIRLHSVPMDAGLGARAVDGVQDREGARSLGRRPRARRTPSPTRSRHAYTGRRSRGPPGNSP